MDNELWSVHGVKTEFTTLTELLTSCHLDSDNNLIFTRQFDDGSHGLHQKVSVVYYRAGYTPNDYFSEHEWAARTLAERSTAIKCPTVGYQLAGTKKVQQALCDDAVLQKFLDTEEDPKFLKQFFASKLWIVNDFRAVFICCRFRAV